MGWRRRSRANCTDHHRWPQVIGVFWGQDYHDAENVRSSKNGAQLDFTIDGAKATFVRNPARGRITVHETDGRVISIDLKKD